jgi:hypothetical protein
MTKAKLSELVLLLILIPAFAYIYRSVEDNLVALILYVGLLLIILVYRLILNAVKQTRIKRIIARNKTSAKIISSKIFNQNTHILQLHVTDPAGKYFTAYVEKSSKNFVRDKYSSGQNISIHVNPADKFDVIIPEPDNQRPSRTRSGSGSGIWIAIFVSSSLIPVIIGLLGSSNKLFKDIAYIPDSKNQGRIWELYFEPENKIYISIIDPLTKKTLKKIKIKKDEDLDAYMNFSIYEQNGNVAIIGIGTTPIFDVYSAATFEKKSGIKELEQTNKILNKGIVEIRNKSIDSRFIKDNIIEIITTDGITCFYDVQKDLFFDSEEELVTYIKKTDKDIMSYYLVAFVLSPVEVSNYQNQLYVITSTSQRNGEELLSNAGSTNFDEKQFNKSKRFNCKKCMTTLLSEEKFLECNMAYTDTSMVVI